MVKDPTGRHADQQGSCPRNSVMHNSITVRVPIFPIVVCVQSAYVIGARVGFRVESGAVVLLQLDL